MHKNYFSLLFVLSELPLYICLFLFSYRTLEILYEEPTYIVLQTTRWDSFKKNCSFNSVFSFIYFLNSSMYLFFHLLENNKITWETFVTFQSRANTSTLNAVSRTWRYAFCLWLINYYDFREGHVRKVYAERIIPKGRRNGE